MDCRSPRRTWVRRPWEPGDARRPQGPAPGWAWQGLGSGIAKVELEEAGGYLGWSKILIVHHDGGGAEALGCRDAKGWVCSSLDGTRAVGGLHACLADATGAKLTVHDPGSGRSWQVETWSSKLAKDDTDSLKHRVGHVVSSSAGQRLGGVHLRIGQRPDHQGRLGRGSI